MKKNKYKPEPDEAVHQWLDKNFCGCGDPELGKETYLEILKWFQPREGLTGYYLSLDEYKKFAEKHGEGLAILMLYVLDAQGITEHGGSVFGSWMTPLGIEVYEWLLTAPKEKEDD